MAAYWALTKPPASFDASIRGCGCAAVTSTSQILLSPEYSSFCEFGAHAMPFFSDSCDVSFFRAPLARSYIQTSWSPDSSEMYAIVLPSGENCSPNSFHADRAIGVCSPMPCSLGTSWISPRMSIAT